MVEKIYKCKICGKQYTTLNNLCSHLEESHKEQIPVGWSGGRYEYYLRKGVKDGKCTECGGSTPWNEVTHKYHRICTKKKCRDKVRERYKKNMINKGKPINMCADDEHQRNMIYAKKTSGLYKWYPPDWMNETTPVDIYYDATNDINSELPIITFPEDEWDNIKKNIEKNKIFYTTRVSIEKNKYIKNKIYLTQWGSLLTVVDVINYKKVNEHPFLSDLSDKQIEIIRKYSENIDETYEVIKLEPSGTRYGSSYELHFLEMLDNFLNFSPYDIFGPSPHTYYYTYQKERKMYIPDFYIPSLNLEIEIKQSTNKHPKIVNVDNVKDKLKDEMMKNNKGIRYIKIWDKDYSEFFALLMELKEKDDLTYVSKSRNLVVNETPEYSYDDVRDFETMVLNTISNGIDSKNIPSTINLVNIGKAIKNKLKYVTDKDMETLGLLINSYMTVLQNIYIDKNNNRYLEAKHAISYLNNNIIPDYNSKINKTLNLTELTPIEEAISILGLKNNNFYKPVFIVLSNTNTIFGKAIKTVTKEPFNHSGISFNTKLNEIYSFNRSGFIIDNINYNKTKDRFKYALYMYLAPMEEYLTMVDALKSILKYGDKFSYNIRGLFDNLIGKSTEYDYKKFCSEFVAEIVKAGNPNLLKKPKNLYTPYGLVKDNKNFIFLKKGFIDEYDEKETDILVEAVFREEDFDDYKIDNGKRKITESLITVNDNEIQYKPVFILLVHHNDWFVDDLVTKITKEPYAHAVLLFDTNFKTTYEFTAKRGFSVSNMTDNLEKLNKNEIKYDLYMYLAPINEYNAMQKALEKYITNPDKYKYNTTGLLDSLNGKYTNYKHKKFCSEFVAEIIKAGTDIYEKESAYYTPCKLINDNFIEVTHGDLREFNEEYINKKVKTILKKEGYKDYEFN